MDFIANNGTGAMGVRSRRASISRAERPLLVLLGAYGSGPILARAILVAVPLVLLLTWLMVRSIGPDAARYNQTREVLDGVAISEAGLHRDALRARIGLLHDYDPLVQDAEALGASNRKLALVVGDAVPQDLQRAGAIAAQQVALVERFKSDNALLQNSLAYFGLLSARLEHADIEPRLVARIGSLANAVMRLGQGASPDRAPLVDEAIRALAVEHVPGEAESDFTALIRHSRFLADLLPRVDETLRRLLALSSAPELSAIRSYMHAMRDRHEAEAARYRLLLYALSLCLLALLVRFGVQVRAGALALQERADLDQLVAAISNRFIACQPEAVDDELSQVLGILGAAVERDRACLIELEDVPQIRLWTRPGVTTPPGWCDAMLEAAPVLAEAPGDLLVVTHGRADITPEMQERLAISPQGCWAAVKIIMGEQVVGLLCFDGACAQPALMEARSGFARMAAAVLSNALVRRRIYEERMAMEDRLQQARRLETVGTLASGVAHNFNNIIGVMLGHAEMAADGLCPESAAFTHVQQVMRAGERARELIGRILDYSRGARAPGEVVLADELLAETVAMAEAACPDVEIITSGRAGAAVVGEPVQLQQVFLNLIRNARQASEPGTRILVSIDRQVVRSRRTLSHGAIPAGSYVRVSVADHGSGIDPGALPHLFQPFFTTRAAGTGLGLATAHEIVRESGGAFNVRSRLGQGSVFEVWLPVAEPTRTEAGWSSGQGESVMIVARDPATLLRDEEMLAALGYEPVGFRTSAAALAAGRADPDRFAALVIDEIVPDGGGVALAAQLRRAMPHHPVLLSSSNPQALRSESLSAAGIASVIVRPWRARTIATALSRALEASRAQDPAASGALPPRGEAGQADRRARSAGHLGTS